MELKVGDRVTLTNDAWEYWTDGKEEGSNPLDCEGTVTVTSKYSFLPFEVVWDNGMSNAYRHGDLKLVSKDFKKGDMVRVIKEVYGTDYSIGRVGSVGYVTEVLPHGVQVAYWPDYDPEAHDNNSLFFINHWVEHV